MQHNSNHHQPTQPIQAPPSLLSQVLQRIHQAEQASAAASHFSTAFESQDWTVRVAAIEQLAHTEKEKALPWLEHALHDTHPSVRAWAIHVLGQHEAYELLLPALEDDAWQVREAAALELNSREAQAAAELPEHMPGDLDTTVSQTAQEVLRQQSWLPTFLGGKKHMIPTDQSTQPLSSDGGPRELGTMQNTPQRLRRARSPRFWSILAACAAILIILGNLFTFKFFTQIQDTSTASSKHVAAIGTTLYTHTFPKSKNAGDGIQIGTMTWSPDGKRLAVAAGPISHGAVQIWDALNGAHEVVLTPPRSSNPWVDREVYATEVAWSPNGTRLASAIGDVQIWNHTTGALMARYFPNVSSTTTVNQVAWSADGRYLAGGYNDSNGSSGIAIWSTSTGMLVRMISASIEEMAWSPDGKYLAASSNGGKVEVWRMPAGQLIQSFNRQASAGPIWSPDSTRIAVTTLSGSIQILEIATGKVVLTYNEQNRQGAMALAWSPDGKRIVSASYVTIQIWNATTGRKIFTYAGQTGNMEGDPALGALAWSPNGQYIASSTRFLPAYGAGGNIQVWQAV
jgi:WD40 repeat protein